MKSKIKKPEFLIPILFFMFWISYSYYDLNIKYSKPVNYLSDAVIINTSDKSYISKAKVTLSGNWKRNGYLFLDSYLTIDFEDNQFPETQNSAHVTISYERKNSRLHIMNLENGSYVAGKGFGDSTLSELIICINDSKGVNTNYYLVSPASNSEEARSLIKEIVTKYNLAENLNNY